jgi:predicted acyltransferase
LEKVTKRAALIFLIGLFLNWSPFVHWQNDQLVFNSWTWFNENGERIGVHIFGVLQRIALCYFFASFIIYYAKVRGAFLIGSILLLVYWALCIAGNPSDPYSLNGWFGTAIDKKILGTAHMYHGEGVAFDPEGIISTLPAIVQVIFGFLVGDYILKRGKTIATNEAEITKASVHPNYQTLTVLFIAAMALLFTGYAWGLSFPINKKIWTSSYVAYTSGLAIVVLATLIYFIEVKNVRGSWTRFFDVSGKNPLFIYALSGLIPELLGIIRISNGTDANGKAAYVSPWSWFHQNVTSKVPGPPENGSLLFALCFVALLWLIGYWMDKKKIYIKV